jgi:uncharacterized coiled-coil protein SlyX
MATRELEPRLRTLEITTATQRVDLETLKGDLQQLEKDQHDFEVRLLTIEKSLVRLAVPLKAATWAAAVLVSAILALIWSLIIGNAQIVFR